MSKDEKMRVLSGTSSVLLIIVGLICFIFIGLSYSAHKPIFNGAKVLAKVDNVSAIAGEKTLEVSFRDDKDDLVITQFKEKAMVDKYTKGDSLYLYQSEGHVYSGESLNRMRRLYLIMVIIGCVSAIIGVIAVKFVVIDWEKRFLIKKPVEMEDVMKAIENSKRQERTPQRRPHQQPVEEDLDLFDDADFYGNSYPQRQVDYYYDPNRRQPQSSGRYVNTSGGIQTKSQQGTYPNGRQQGYPPQNGGTWQARPTNRNRNRGNS